jgi:hypothetical protein
MALEFGSFLTYTPRPTNQAQRLSKNITLTLKEDEFLPTPQMPISEFLTRELQRSMPSLPFSDFFKSKPVLVPTPSSSLTKPGTLWVPARLASAMASNGLGASVIESLIRVKPLPKAATSAPDSRPTAKDHYESREVQKHLKELNDILLVDDVITRGATLLGAANRLAEAYPNARVRAFAMIRTISSASEFIGIQSPARGTVRLVGDQTRRSP